MTRWRALAAGLLALLPAAAPAQPGRSHSVLRTDGSSLVYHVDRPAGARRAGALLVLQGSGCEPVQMDKRVRGYGRMLAPERVLVTIEKYGVGAAQTGDQIEGCSAAYWRGNTLTRRVLDALAVVAALRRESWWSGDVAIFGGSEGGAVAAMLAPLVPETRAVIVYSSGIGVPVGDLVRMAVPPPVRQQADEVFEEVRRDPDPARRWGGASYAWWADAVDQVAARSLLQTRAPILLIHGSRDQYADVSTARATRDLLAGPAGSRFTYREYAGYDHFMTDAAGVDHRPRVLSAARDWLRRTARR